MVNEIALYTWLVCDTLIALGASAWAFSERHSADRVRGRERLTHDALEAARLENSQATGEILALKAQLRAANGAADLLGKRNKLLAVELRGSDGTAKTCVWPQAKPEVFMRTDLSGPNGEGDPWL